MSDSLTSDLLLINSDGLSSPLITMKLPDHLYGTHPFGWGVGWYPGDNQAAILAKDPIARETQMLKDVLTDWSNFRSTVFLCKVKGAAEGYTHHETQPFSRSFAGKDWLFVHNGYLDKVALGKLHTNKSGFLEPLGKTDSELAFCFLLGMMQESKARKLSDVSSDSLLRWFEQLDALGSADMMITDGMSIACYHGTQSPRDLYHTRLHIPSEQMKLDSEAAILELNDPRDTYRTTLIITSACFTSGHWIKMEPGQLIIVKRAFITWDSKLLANRAEISTADGPLPLQQMDFTPMQVEQSKTHHSVTNIRSITRTVDGKSLGYRLFNIMHTTEYKYTHSVERSTHKFRLIPVQDHIQDVVHSSLTVSCVGEEIQYEDVFGNQSIRYSINKPYEMLSIQSKNQVKVYARPPDDHSLSRRQTSIPLVWMPWQRQMMMPYLLPMELPETQLEELTMYAMSFVERNDYHLLDTIKDVNLSIYRDYKYLQGTTSLKTTPFEVYTTRKGVCQDFANLFICMARLLGVPARYRMGYIFTGANYENKIQSDASHAWVEVYLPYVGWRGYDPTNGCLVEQDHIRVACGRNYRDATPTSGTIFKGGGTETLKVDVKIEEA